MSNEKLEWSVLRLNVNTKRIEKYIISLTYVSHKQQ